MVRETVTELNVTIETRNNEYSTLMEQFNALNVNFTNLTAEHGALVTFKKDVIENQKKAIIAEYNEVLDSEVLNEYLTNLDNYSLEELDMRLTYECKKANPSIFSKNSAPQSHYIPKEEPKGRGINDILAHYERK
jgi:predicted transcriptional regulator